jgi:hypothetical protein
LGNGGHPEGSPGKKFNTARTRKSVENTMNRVEGPTNATQTVRASSGDHDLPPASDTNGAAQGVTDLMQQDASAAARPVLRDALADSGSTDRTGSDPQSYDLYLTCDPAPAEMDDRRPGLLRELEAWMRNRSSGAARQTPPI